MTLVRKIYRSWNEQDVYDACKLCLGTDTRWLKDRALHSCVAEALVGGVTMVVMRAKGADIHRIVAQARKIIPLCRVANVPFIVDDNIEAAKAAGSDGVHLWKFDTSCDEVRKEFGRDAIVGVSVDNVDEAVLAEEQGASYLSVGPVFVGRRREAEGLIPRDELRAIAETVSIPVMAVGGITPGNVSELSGTEVAGVTCISSILAAPDIEKAARDMSAEVDSYLRSRTIL